MTGRRRGTWLDPQRAAAAARMRDAHVDQAGLSAGAEALVFGVLVFVVGTILALNGWAVLDADFAVNAAAREAVRTVIEAGDAPSEDTMTALRAVADETLSGHGKDALAATVEVVDSPWGGGADGAGGGADGAGGGADGAAGGGAGQDGGARVQRCARVTIEVRYPVQGIRLPLIGSWTTPITAVGQHSEIIDPFRSGLTGRAGCG